jgi:hypothetical protein
VTALKDEPYFMDVTRYEMQIRPFIDCFGSNQVMVIDFEDFNKNRKDVLARVCEFIEVDYDRLGNFESMQSNVSVGGNKSHIRFDKPNAFYGFIKKRLPWVWNMMKDNSGRAFDTRPVIPNDLLTDLLLELEPDIDSMEQILNKDLSHWRVSSSHS